MEKGEQWSVNEKEQETGSRAAAGEGLLTIVDVCLYQVVCEFSWS